MLVREVMSRPVVTIRRTESVRRGIRMLVENDITAAPVVDEAGSMVGIVSEMDLLRGEFQADPRAHLRPVSQIGEPPPRRVEEVMTSKVLSVTETTDVMDLVNLMMTTKVKSVPVLRDGEIVGMVSRRDLMAVLGRSDESIRAGVLDSLREHYPHISAWDIVVHDGVVGLRDLVGGYTDEVAEQITRTVPGVVRVRHLAAT